MTRQFAEALTDRRHQAYVDHGLGVPKVYNACEQLDVEYTIGIGMNARLKKLSDPLLEEAVSRFDATGEPQRLFCAFWYRADSWSAHVMWWSIRRQNRRQPTSWGNQPNKTCRSKRWEGVAAVSGTIVDANTTRWVRATRAPGVHA